MGWCHSTLTLAGVEVGGFGSHSFRRGSDLALIHSGASDPVTGTEALRHRSLFSSRPYITYATRTADLAVTRLQDCGRAPQTHFCGGRSGRPRKSPSPPVPMLDRSLAQRLCVRFAARQTNPARPRRCDDTCTFIAADSRESADLPCQSVCHARPVCHSAGLGDTGRAAVGRAGSFNSGKSVTVPFLLKARRAGSRRSIALPDRMIRPCRRRAGQCQPDSDQVPDPTKGRQSTDSKVLFQVKRENFYLLGLRAFTEAG